MINIDDRLIDQLTADQMWLLLHIVKRINADGECWPSTKTLWRDSKWSDVKKVRKVRDELVSVGILEAYERTRDDGGQASNLYRIKTDYIGVYVTAKRLQNLTRGEGKNLTRGVGKEDTRGEGKNLTRANEVLTNEVLTNEPTHTQSENEIVNPSTWMNNSTDRTTEAIETLMAEFEKNPSLPRELCEMARVSISEEQVKDEAEKWLRWNGDNYPVIQYPIKALTSGRNNFLAWLRNVKNHNHESTNTGPNGRVQQQRKSGALLSPDELKQRLGLL